MTKVTCKKLLGNEFNYFANERDVASSITAFEIKIK